MVWTEEVHSNRKAVQRKPPQSGTQPRKPNAKLISLVAATGAVALTVWWRREGRKLNGRQLRIPFLDGLQNWFRSIGNESGKTARQPQQQQQWKGQRPENMAGAAALARATVSTRWLNIFVCWYAFPVSLRVDLLCDLMTERVLIILFLGPTASAQQTRRRGRRQ